MCQLGGEHEALARFPGDPTIVWGHMQELWERQASELHKRIDMLGETNRTNGDGDEKPE